MTIKLINLHLFILLFIPHRLIASKQLHSHKQEHNININVAKFFSYETNSISAVKQLWKDISVIIQLNLD